MKLLYLFIGAVCFFTMMANLAIAGIGYYEFESYMPFTWVLFLNSLVALYGVLNCMSGVKRK